MDGLETPNPPGYEATMTETEDNHIREGFTKTGHYGTIHSKETSEQERHNREPLAGSKIDGGHKNRCCGFLSEGYITEIWTLFHLAWPLILSGSSFCISGTVALIFCGHMGTAELDAFALAASIMFMTGTMVAFGMSSACDTYFSQYHGSVNRHKLGVILQKSLLIMLLTAVPSVALQMNGELVLRLIGQDSKVARLAGRYMLLQTPGTFMIFVAITLIRFLQCQNVVLPTLFILVGSFLLNVLGHFVFINVVGMGMDGSAVALLLSQFAGMCGFIIYVRYSGILHGIWEGWSTECLEEWGGFCKLGLLGLVIVCVDTLCIEIGLLLAGLLSEIQLSAQGVLFQLHGIFISSIVGLGLASGVRVGNLLGAGDVDSARKATRVSSISAVLFGSTVAIILASLRFQLPYIYTTNKDTVELVSTITPVLSARIFLASIGLTIEGVLRGCGRQAVDAVIVFCGHTVSLVVGISLMFQTPLGVLGMWVGFTSGMTLEVVVGNIVLITTDWEHQVQRALKLTKSIPDEKTNLKQSDNKAVEPALETSLRRHSSTGSYIELQDVAKLKRGDDPLTTQPDSSHKSDKVPDKTPSRDVSKMTIVKRLFALLAVVNVFLIGLIIRVTAVIDSNT